MAIIKVEAEVSKEIYELTKGLIAFVVKVQAEVKDNDGWSLTDDFMGILEAIKDDLIPALQGVGDIAEEYNADKEAAAKAILLGLSELADVLKKGE